MLILDDNNVCPLCGAYLDGWNYCSNGHWQPKANWLTTEQRCVPEVMYLMREPLNQHTNDYTSPNWFWIERIRVLKLRIAHPQEGSPPMMEILPF